MEVHFKRLRPRIEAALERYVPDKGTVPERLRHAMRYSLFAGGKRLRPVLVALAYEAVGGRGSGFEAAAAAVEMVHTYSLIHDDLPAMDDDDLRRGKPTCHRVHGEATAILAGDGLLTRAFEVLAGAGTSPDIRTRLISDLAAAAGPAGMVGGQILDLAAEGADPDPELARAIPALKTASLIRASARMGAIAAGAAGAVVETLGGFGDRIGLAFQVRDDLLDRQGSAGELGKTPGKDARSAKLTYPSLIGEEAAARLAATWVREAKALLGAEPAYAPLCVLADFMFERQL